MRRLFVGTGAQYKEAHSEDSATCGYPMCHYTPALKSGEAFGAFLHFLQCRRVNQPASHCLNPAVQIEIHMGVSCRFVTGEKKAQVMEKIEVGWPMVTLQEDVGGTQQPR